jgi:hypothetical protein
MTNFLKLLLILAVVAGGIIAAMLILGVGTVSENQETLLKILGVIGIVAVVGIISLLVARQ